MRRHRQLLRALSLCVVASAVLAGCAPGLAANPRYATDSGAHPQGQPRHHAAQAGPPPIEAPKNDLSVARLHVTGVQRRRRRAHHRRHAAVRQLRRRPRPASAAPPARSASAWSRPRRPAPRPTPGPLVMTTGTDLPSSVQLPAWLCRNGIDVLKTNPIVAVDRRGIGHVGRPRLPRLLRPTGDARAGAVRIRRRPGRQPGADRADRHHQLHRHHRARRLGLRQRSRRRGHRTAAQHLGRPDARVARHRQRRPGGPGLRRVAPEQGGAAGARLAAATGHRRRGRRRTEGQGSAGRARRVRHPVRRGGGCPLGPDPKGAVDDMLAGRPRRPRAPEACRWRCSPTPSPPRWRFPSAIASAPPTDSPAPWPPRVAATPAH